MLYARVPVAGSVKTRFLPSLGAAAAADLHRALLLDSLELVATAARRFSARPAIAWSEPWHPATDGPEAPIARAVAGFEELPQAPGDLGARLDDTLSRLLVPGRGPAVILGSDSPTLPPGRIGEALERLAGHDLVLGPAEDGGYYLIGARRPLPGMFAGVGWGGPGALDDTRAGAERAGGTVALLHPWYDIDRPADLARLRRDADAGIGTRPARTLEFLERINRPG
ncbi:MAG: TIGR04282 family arsenosugar biosynthesis glycosyltransferase [Candidatus Polarisedimenticolia bacterium]